MQKLLSCVYRVGQRFAAGYVTNVLRGKSDEWILRNQHNQLSTFGIGDDLTDKEWRSVIRQCISLGYLTVNTQQYQSLQLTDDARKVLKGEAEVWLRPLKRDKAATQKPKEEWLRTEREERIWQALRKWRMEKAKAAEVPAYVICGDKTLRDVVEKLPQNLTELHEIYGLGEAKINSFGLEILEVCQTAVNGQDTPSENANENISDGLTSERDKIMWQTLTAWRGKQAQTEGVALSKILSDDTLLDLIRLTPETDLDLQGVHGLGQVRIGRYATDILSVCYPFSDSLEDEAVSTRKLMRELLEWCTKTARLEDIEQHRIFSKATLRAIAAKKPRTMAALAEIHGVGEEKLAKYGETVLEIVEEFLI